MTWASGPWKHRGNRGQASLTGDGRCDTSVPRLIPQPVSQPHMQLGSGRTPPRDWEPFPGRSIATWSKAHLCPSPCAVVFLALRSTMEWSCRQGAMCDIVAGCLGRPQRILVWFCSRHDTKVHGWRVGRGDAVRLVPLSFSCGDPDPHNAFLGAGRHAIQCLSRLP